MKLFWKRPWASPLRFWLLTTVCAVSSIARGESASAPGVLPRGRLQADGVAGAAVLDGEPRLGWSTSLRIGLGAGVEIAAPAALAVHLVGTEDVGSLYFGLGIFDIYINDVGDLLFQPSVMAAGVGHFGPMAAFRGAVDFSGAEKGIHRGDHPFWLRGSIGLLLDMGHVATLGFGLSYQRVVLDGDVPDEVRQTGWAGDSRIVFGSVRTQPFADLPMLSIHLQEGIDFVFIGRFDVNLDEGSTDIRCLVGFSLQAF